MRKGELITIVAAVAVIGAFFMGFKLLGTSPEQPAEVESESPAIDALSPEVVSSDASSGGAGDEELSGEGSAPSANPEAKREAEKMRQAEELLGLGRQAFEKGDYESAVTSYNEALGVLPGGEETDQRRRVLEGHLAEAMVALARDYRQAGQNAKALEKLNQVIAVDPDNRQARQELAYLQAESPEEEPPSGGKVTVEFKLKNIIVPVVDFNNLTVGEAIDYLRRKTQELDEWETDPLKQGVNFVIRGGAATTRGVTLKLRNVPAYNILVYVCELSRLRFEIGEVADGLEAVILMPTGR